MPDYYELLEVEPGATKDEIRTAYRALRDRLEVELEEGRSAARRDDAARRLGDLHRAWAVLSDPVQRDRYDAARARGDLDAAGGVDAGAAAVTDTGAPARPGRRPDRAPSAATVTLPPGMHLGEVRARLLAALFDLSVLALIYLVGVSVVLPAALRSRYPERVARIEAIEAEINRLDRRVAELRKQRRQAEEAISEAVRAERARREGEVATARRQLRTANRDAARIEARIEARREEARDLQGAFLAMSYVVALGILVACLAYLVPSTVVSGQTLGKRLRRLWVVRVDGRRASWGRVGTRYLLPVALAVLVPQLGLVVALGVVAWSLRDPNRQGLHDRLAGTLVVDRPPLDH